MGLNILFVRYDIKSDNTQTAVIIVSTGLDTPLFELDWKTPYMILYSFYYRLQVPQLHFESCHLMAMSTNSQLAMYHTDKIFAFVTAQ